ncbi:diphosphate--fructose-6-phosphate 1-phosphotransferase [Thermorudis peleae]|uniref:diphosphate--fructose-6-phosphate 1-phosphotransferase n=1 Tax=Thermorudis peleae TaxID=1382356 RepID=UPI000571D41F|nr:diphosphate--fructose-6-phosphate 1-phosphotransferase [Thermorudis peleae]
MSRPVLVLAQGGGATAVINSSLIGAVEAALSSRHFAAILGARYGIEGVLRQDFVDLSAQPPEIRQAVAHTPSAALGTTRVRLSPEMADIAVSILQRHHVSAFIYIGGNDSAETALRLARAAERAHYPLQVVVVPKTIDNDLPETDHCPGYGSVARFWAYAARDAGLDTAATAALFPVKLLEVMGRNAGWIAAATALGQTTPDDPPHLIFFPERPPQSLEDAVTAIQQVHAQYGMAVVVVPETLRDATGRPLGGAETRWVDPFGHPYHPSPAAALARAVETKLGLRARIDQPGTIARMLSLAVSSVDWQEAWTAGAHAVRLLTEGATEVMVTLKRIANEPYTVSFGAVPLSRVAGRERQLPDAFISEDGHRITPAFRHYALPLIGEPPPPPGRFI